MCVDDTGIDDDDADDADDADADADDDDATHTASSTPTGRAVPIAIAVRWDADDDDDGPAPSVRALGQRCARDAGLSLPKTTRGMVACCDVCACAHGRSVVGYAGV